MRPLTIGLIVVLIMSLLAGWWFRNFERVELERYVGPKAGLPTLRDIAAELARPGRDPRPRFQAFSWMATLRS